MTANTMDSQRPTKFGELRELSRDAYQAQVEALQAAFESSDGDVVDALTGFFDSRLPANEFATLLEQYADQLNPVNLEQIIDIALNNSEKRVKQGKTDVDASLAVATYATRALLDQTENYDQLFMSRVPQLDSIIKIAQTLSNQAYEKLDLARIAAGSEDSQLSETFKEAQKLSTHHARTAATAGQLLTLLRGGRGPGDIQDLEVPSV